MVAEKPPTTDSPRIGVYVCHCGSNIASVVTPSEVVGYAQTLPGVVVAKEHRYMCSDPGQALIAADVKENRLDRVVVAACSVAMHEPTFRACIAEAGLNPFMFEMANIREHDSWVHAHEKEAAIHKAKEIVASAVAKVSYGQPLEMFHVPVTRRAMVIGGGIAGISAALDLADMQIDTYLVERTPTIGGRMAQLDKTFPTMDCSICIEAPKMVDVGKNKRIHLLTYSEVKEVNGYIGNFEVTVERKPRYVLLDRCTGCGLCVEVCPIDVPNEFEEGLGPRKAIYVPMAQAVPSVYTIDRDACIECYKCVDACGSLEAITFAEEPEQIKLDIGTIIVATGYDMWDPTEIEEYGFGVYDNVTTMMEIERLHCAGGPTVGEFIRPSDGKTPKTLGLIQCVGSRDKRYHEYPGKTYEEFYERAREAGIHFVQGRPAEIREVPGSKNLIVRADNVSLGRPMEYEFEMVGLSTAAVSSDGSESLARVLTVPTDSFGFFMESHPKLKPIDTPTEGIYLAGSAQGPKDIPQSVGQGSGAAGRAARVLSHDEWEIDPIVAYVYPDRCINSKGGKCTICYDACPYGAIDNRPGSGEPSRIISAKCHACGTCVAECPHNAITQHHFTDGQVLAQIHALLADKPEEKVLAFTCRWCSGMGADNAGVSHFEYPANTRNIMVMCAGRVDRDFVMEAFRLGAGAVLVSGCHPQDCHYITGRDHAEERMGKLAVQLANLGIAPGRFRLESVSATEGAKWARIMREMSDTVRELGSEAIAAENAAARPQLTRLLRRMSEVPGVSEVLRLSESARLQGIATPVEQGHRNALAGGT
ncbi:MAG: hydrogenase iron-sulfur subunit [Anaerolineae bacterium]|nr:hydrogenase iron-sulfur subunit [Anaerolineae bacterium]